MGWAALAPDPGELRSAGPSRGSLFPGLRLSPPLPWDSLKAAGSPPRSAEAGKRPPPGRGGAGAGAWSSSWLHPAGAPQALPASHPIESVFLNLRSILSL